MDKNPYVAAASHANVYRLRTGRNETWNVAYFFNDGSLDAEDLLQQLLIVITACEIVGLKVKLQMSDAGGANQRASSLLTGTVNQRHQDGRPAETSLKYINPL